MRESLDHDARATLLGDASAINQDWDIGVETGHLSYGGDRLSLGERLGVGRVHDHCRLLGKSILVNEDVCENVRNCRYRVSKMDKLTLVCDLRGMPTRVGHMPPQSGQILMRVPHQFHRSTLSAGAEHRARAHPQHPKVVCMDDVGFELVDRRPEGEFPIPN